MMLFKSVYGYVQKVTETTKKTNSGNVVLKSR